MKKIVLVPGDGPVQEGEQAIGGNPDFTRSMWLDRVDEVAVVVAAECHSNEVSPVVRVGGGASGVASLKDNSGVTGDIKNFPWDVFAPRLKRAYDVQPQDATLVSEVRPAIDEHVEEDAIHGDEEALTEVIAVAAEGDPEEAGHAKEVLTHVPLEELEHWNEVHE